LIVGIGHTTARISNAVQRAAVKIAAHGVVGGAAAALQGQSFPSGFASSAVSAGITYSGLGTALPGNDYAWSRTVRAAVIGGTVSALGGGKFANGAVTAAFQHLFNHEIHDREDGSGSAAGEIARIRKWEGYSTLSAEASDWVNRTVNEALALEADGLDMSHVWSYLDRSVVLTLNKNDCLAVCAAMTGLEISVALNRVPMPSGAAESAGGIVAQNGTKITGFTGHGIERVIGGGAKRAGTRPEAILDALKNPQKIVSGVDNAGRPFQVFTGKNARVVVNPQTGKVVSVNPLSRAGAHGP
jgi:hypothetical protein